MTEELHSLCSCGREKPELGCDLCRVCREEYEERQAQRESEPCLGPVAQAQMDWLFGVSRD